MSKYMHVTEKSQRIVSLKTNLNISLQTKPTHNIESSKLFNFKKKKIIQLKFSYNKRCIVYLYESGISNPQTQADANVLACSNLKDEESIITKMQCLQFDFAHHDKEIIGYCFMKDNTLHFRLVSITVTKPIQFVTLLKMDCGKMENSTKFIDFNFNQDKFKNILVFINLNEFIQFVIYDDENQGYEIGILQKSITERLGYMDENIIPVS
ncbi:hypothetical protein A3Q56_02155 [Intoshia linei]|uniref:Uncharacterized protein n=1 Tax=Intoshia linei TaxID=1819745 RepID=A0A177B778_9BILA|nr:hypothetical protein A3Q56_02155 [Intoshia linei]